MSKWLALTWLLPCPIMQAIEVIDPAYIDKFESVCKIVLLLSVAYLMNSLRKRR
jgi:hypothetical protein